MNQKPPFIARFLPSMTDFAFLMPLVFLFARLNGAETMLGDGDTGWHVRIGEWIMAHRAVPHQDLFSYTKPGAPFFAWEWLWDLCFGWLHLHFGLAAVVGASLVVLCLTSGLLFRAVARVCDNRLLAIAVTFIAVAGSSIHWLARPHLFTLLFLTIWLNLLVRIQQTGQTRLLWWMPALTVPWTNLHGGFFVGIALLLMYAAGAVADGLFASAAEARLQNFRTARSYTLTALACAAASFINPYTWHLHAHIIAYFRDSFNMEYINEFQTMSFHNPATWYLEIMLGLGLLACAWNLARRRFTPLILVAAWGHMALVASRNIPLFLLIAAPVVGGALAEMIRQAQTSTLPGWFVNRLRRLSAAAEEFGAIDRIPRVYAFSAAAAALVIAGLYGNSPLPKWRAEYSPKKYPAAALELLSRDVAKHRIFTDDEWGDYLAYRLFPLGGKVFVDGRSDFYGGEFGLKYVDVLNVKYTWQATLDSYGVDTLLLRADSSLAGAVKESRRWRIIYDDGISLIFTPVKTDAHEFSTTSGKIRDAGSIPTGVARGTQSTVKERTTL